MEIIAKKCTSIVLRSIFNSLSEARQLYMEHRVNEFISTIEDQVEYLDAERQAEINIFLGKKDSQKFLSDYAAAITNTSSDIVIRALALLFVSDKQFDFDQRLKSRFITCFDGVDDLKVDLFLRLSKLTESSRLTIYPLYAIDWLNFEDLDLGIDIDELFSYVDDFIRRGILLRDPTTESGAEMYQPMDHHWSLSFGISTTLQRYAVLLEKAKYLSGN
ncbi:hypothetical protein [Vibrio coralliirubri]|uniref:hypothetical protein n=1 Tax=Vibrio coralliirubri TaxID=1516159 RepID=UPI0021C33A59|nr:hypothetical protein [Vibrio coralliirubri]